MTGRTVRTSTEVPEQAANRRLRITDEVWFGGMIRSARAVTGLHLAAGKSAVSLNPTIELAALPGWIVTVVMAAPLRVAG